MMKSYLPLFGLLLAGILTGVFGGRFVADHAGARPSMDHGSAGGSATLDGRPARKVLTPAADAHDIKSLLRWWILEESGGSEESMQLGRMDGAEIRSLMGNLVRSMSEEGWEEIDSLLSKAADELFRREGENALRWADALDVAGGRETILHSLIGSAARNDPALAKSWYDHYRLEFAKSSSSSILAAAIRGATARGVEDMIELKKIFGNDLLFGMPIGPLPDDFDYRLFINNFSAGEPDSRTTVQYWAAKDPEAAWAGVRELAQTEGQQAAMYMGALFAGKAVGGKEKEAIRWLLPKLAEFSQDDRNRALDDLFNDSWGPRMAIAEVMAELPGDEDRIVVALGVINPNGASPWALEALRSIGSPAGQVSTLLRSVSRHAGDVSSQEIRFYTNLMDELRLPREDREKIDAELWKRGR
ncbi:hypothetical protein JIN84_14665 [Luteolibacter yonseiensis]|uniref:Uncharacterized protein n=1 Tax=Luteolibacter yonseiensis TaxID=1144680 RepID=A0A934R7X1_9BACT|nr:hypothetical protein [Luteolibacter yonseiensis]MBK1816865.1 hypothetical protein [Luteolibacter yonseiensis]